MKRLLLITSLAVCYSSLVPAAPLGTAFTYQGRLNDGNNPATGSYDLRFAIYDAVTNGNVISGVLTNAATPVSNGLLTVKLDFGSGTFTGEARWLETAARTNGSAEGFEVMAPRNELTPAPYAIMAGSASNLLGAVSLSQLPAAVVTNGAAAVALSGTFTGNGANLTNVNAATLAGLNATNFWQLGGNNVASGQFLGSTNNQALEFKAGGQRALRLEPNLASGAPNVIGGAPGNFAGPGVQGATIGGGGANDGSNHYTNSVTSYYGTVGGGASNNVNGPGGTVGGGQFNSAYQASTVGGGYGNVASGGNATVAGGYANKASSDYATVGGGAANTASGLATVAGGNQNTASAYRATVSGGYYNTASATEATVGGGSANTASGQDATVSGGWNNEATNSYATVPGGYQNSAGGQFSLAAGKHAKAVHDGAFVWADNHAADFVSTAGDQFLIRAQGGVGIGLANPAATLEVAGVRSNGIFAGSNIRVTGAGGNGAMVALDLATYQTSSNLPNAQIRATEYLFGADLDFLTKDSGAPNNYLLPRVRITRNGNVGIGTTNPATALDVNGTVKALAFSGNGANVTNLNSAALTGTLPLGTLPGAVVTTNYQNSVTLSGTFTGNGSGLSNTTAVALGGLAVSNFWQLGGNTVAPGQFLGSTNDQPLEFWVKGHRALRLEPTTNTDDRLSNSVNLVGGPPGNFIAPGVHGSVILGGGGQINYFASTNSVYADDCFLGSGSQNSIQSNAYSSFLGGGFDNHIETNARHSFLGGGGYNLIMADSDECFLGGGFFNSIEANSSESVLVGGSDNHIGHDSPLCFLGGGDLCFVLSNSTCSFLGGGEANMINTYCAYSVLVGGTQNVIDEGASLACLLGGLHNVVGARLSVVPGGDHNYAGGQNSFAAGHRAKAQHDGAFVWGDTTDADVTSSADNQFMVRASGGTVIYSGTDTTHGVSLAANGGSWTSLSDRHAKSDIEPVDSRALLEKVAALPVSTWRYNGQNAAIRHIGPMAQDFKAAFQVGETDKGITTIDADGVALAAIQGLNQKVEEQAAALKAKDAELQALKQRLEAIEKLLVPATPK